MALVERPTLEKLPFYVENTWTLMEGFPDTD
jgi:hypothetical protein